MGMTAGPLIWLLEKMQGRKFDPNDMDLQQDLARLKALPDAEKIRLMDQAFEMAGGAVGATAGAGLMSIPAAGAGAVLGRNLSRGTAALMGLQQTPTTAGEEVIEQAKTFGMNAGGEALGRAIPLAYNALPKAVKQLPLRAAGAVPAVVDAVQPSNVAGVARNAIRKLAEQTPEAKILADLAKKHGVQLDFGQASGQPIVQLMGLTMARSPFSTNKIMKARQAQYKQYEDSIGKFLNSYHQGEISLEDFARMADTTISNAQKQFNQRVGAGTAAAAKQLNPTPVSDVEAGVGLRAGADANEQAVRDWSRKAYGDIDVNHGDTQIDMTPLGRKAMDILQGMPPEQLQAVFPQSAVRLLKSAHVTPSAEDVPLAERMFAEMNGLPTPTGEKTPPVINLRQAMKVRSELLARASKMTGPTDKPYQRQAYQLADAVNEAMEESLAATPGAEDVYGKLRSVNDQYRQYMEKLRAPLGPGKPGSTAAPMILSENIPERLPAQVAASPTMMQQTSAAVRPGMVPGSTNAVDPTQLLRRNRFDSIVDKATIVDPATGFSRISPTRFSDALPEPGTAQALFGQQLPDVTGIGKPKLVAREQLLYNSPLAKGGDNADTVFNAAFPKRSFGGNVDETLQLFQEAGKLPEAQRAFGQQLFAKSETQIPSIGDDHYTNPRTLEKNLFNYGETVPRVMGPKAPAKINEYVDLGKGLTEAEHRFGNPSGTGRMMHIMSTVQDMLPTPSNIRNKTMGDVVLKAKASVVGADRFTDPSKYSTLLDPPEKILGLGDYAGGGNVGRVAIQLPPKAESAVPEFGTEVPEFGTPEDLSNDVPEFGVPETPKPKRKP
jgi:hypothetical protein